MSTRENIRLIARAPLTRKLNSLGEDEKIYNVI